MVTPLSPPITSMTGAQKTGLSFPSEASLQHGGARASPKEKKNEFQENKKIT